MGKMLEKCGNHVEKICTSCTENAHKHMHAKNIFPKGNQFYVSFIKALLWEEEVFSLYGDRI